METPRVSRERKRQQKPPSWVRKGTLTPAGPRYDAIPNFPNSFSLGTKKGAGGTLGKVPPASGGADLKTGPRAGCLLGPKHSITGGALQLRIDFGESPRADIRKLLGPGGSHVRGIAARHNAKLRVRGIGSGHAEGRGRREAQVPLHLSISASSQRELEGGPGQHAQAFWPKIGRN